MTITTIPAHTFEPAKRATKDGLADDPMCGYLHRLAFHPLVDGEAVFCSETADAPVHNGSDKKVRVCGWTDEETERGNQ